jgi:hypothetical protein
MKGRVLTFILVGTLAFGFFLYKGWLSGGQIVEVKAHYVEVFCGDNTIDMRVTEVSDSSVQYIVGKTISPEGQFFKKDFGSLVKSKAKERGAANTVKEFTLVGYLVQGESKHCFGSACFKVQKFKSEGEQEFIVSD